MEPLKQHKGVVIPMNRANVDTDAIMPKQYLKCISKYGYGDWAFDDWRYLDAGDVEIDVATRAKNTEFELNQTQYAGGSILLAQKNFGCGSSREHAVWGLRDYGIKVLIAPVFADIFFNNCFNNGLLAIELPQAEIDRLFSITECEQGVTLTVDLEQQHILLPGGELLDFKVDAGRREKLLKGLDNIGVTLSKSEKIKAFEKKHKQHAPWLFEDL